MNKNGLILVLIIVALATITIFILLKNNSKTRVEYCGPGKTDPVTIFKNPDEAFPAFANGYKVKLQSGVNLLDTLTKATGNINAGSDIQSEIVELREKLNQDNIRMENLMRASFYAYNSRPCDPEISRRYLNMLDTLAQKITELEKFKASIAVPAKGGGDTSALVLTTPQIKTDTASLKRSLVALKREYPAVMIRNPKIKEP